MGEDNESGGSGGSWLEVSYKDCRGFGGLTIRCRNPWAPVSWRTRGSDIQGRSASRTQGVSRTGPGGDRVFQEFLGSGTRNQAGSLQDDGIEGCGWRFVFWGEWGLLGAGQWVGRTGVMNSGSRARGPRLLLGVGMQGCPGHKLGQVAGRGLAETKGVVGCAGRAGPRAAWELTLLPRETEPGVGKQ